MSRGPKRHRAAPNQGASDLLNRDFTATAPNHTWVTDITEHRTREGKVHCTVVLDTFSHRMMGWSIDSSPTAALVTNALDTAIDNRAPQADAIIQSDHSVQYRSWTLTRRAKDPRPRPLDS